MITGWNHYGFHFIAWYNIFYVIGFLGRKHGSGVVVFLRAHKVLSPFAVVSALAWLLMIPCWTRNEAITLPLIGTIPGVCAFAYRFMAIAFAVSWEMIVLSKVTHLPKLLDLLGRNTLGIYAVHGLIMGSLSSFFTPISPWLGIPLLFVTALGLSLIAVLGIRRIPVLGQYLVG